ncbi:MAG: heparinase, partial [Phycisphaerales bacterium]|nr:heparinase [Phycisphaerales bacterium]
PVPVALFRSAWGDPNALFVSIKAGYNQVNHGHLDLGAFELDALGVRWARDLGSDNYNLPGYWHSRSETGGRWKYYRLNSQSHSVPLINGKDQSAYGKSSIVKFEPARVVIDFTSAYKQAASKATRELKLVDNRKSVLVQDDFTLSGAKGVEITWAMTTDAKIDIKSKTLAELTLDGKKLTAKILSPSGAEFGAESAGQKPPQRSNKGVSRLLAKVKNAKGKVRISILLAPQW